MHTKEKRRPTQARYPDASSKENPRELLAELSHNLQTPLAILKARVERLRFPLVHDGRMHDDFRKVDDSIDSLSRAIAEILAASAAPGRTQCAVNKQRRFSLSKLIQDVASDAAIVAESQGIALITHIAPRIMCFGDARALYEAGMNLLGNAVKYMGDGPRKEIIVRLTREGAHAMLTVTDTGIGIPPKDVPHIFNRFYRGARVYDVAPGMGLGLASVERAVSAHGGRIEVSSAVGEGSTFTISLPLR